MFTQAQFDNVINQPRLRDQQGRQLSIEAGQLGGFALALLADAGDLGLERAARHGEVLA